MDERNICAGIVTYIPEIHRLQENIDSISKQVDKVFIVDNGSNNAKDIRNLAAQYRNVMWIGNEQNEGIARALNQIITEADKNNYKWVLTLDQDSICDRNLIKKYIPYIEPKIGMLTCDIVDRNFQFVKKPSTLASEEVEKCITSGCLTNVAAVLRSGGFDEALFMDMVDYDMCYTLQEHGYRIVNVHFNGLLHEIGKSRKYNILGFEFAVNNHSAERKYTISRNSVYLIKKHKLNPIKEYALVFRRIFTVLFFEKGKFNKIAAIIKGVLDGWKMQRSLCE